MIYFIYSRWMCFYFIFFFEECARTIICSWNGSTTSTSYSNIWNEISKGAKQYFLWISHWVYCVWNIYIDMFRILFLCVDRKLNVTWHTIFLCIRTVYTPVKLTLNAMSIDYYSSLNHDTKKNRLQKKIDYFKDCLTKDVFHSKIQFVLRGFSADHK